MYVYGNRDLLFLSRPLSHSTQGFQRVPSDQAREDMVGRPVMHLSAPQQATGEARYILYVCIS